MSVTAPAELYRGIQLSTDVHSISNQGVVRLLQTQIYRPSDRRVSKHDIMTLESSLLMMLRIYLHTNLLLSKLELLP